MSFLSATFLVVTLLNHLISANQPLKVNFSVKEGQKNNQQIGDLLQVLKAKRRVEDGLRFKVIDRKNGGRRKYFQVDERTGVITLITDLDREEICEKRAVDCTISLTVDAGYETFLDVKITILDDNDNPPVFPMMEKWLTLPENSPLGKIISLPVAKDDDGPSNGVVKYTMKSVKTRGLNVRDLKEVNDLNTVKNYLQVVSQKEINQLIPKLKIIREIDREKISKFTFLLVAEDSGKKSASVTIIIKVMDVNDNAPFWKTNPIVKNLEECVSEKEILKLDAQDLDDSAIQNGQISYKISDRTPDLPKIRQMMYISSDKLYLTDMGFRNYRKNKVTFFVSATDGPGLTTDVKVTLNIIDCNDNAPNIDIKNMSALIFENNPGIHMLSYVVVEDRDIGKNSDFDCILNDTTRLKLQKAFSPENNDRSKRVMYKIETEPDKSFDREKMSKYNVIIKCEDRGSPPQKSQKMFTVTILDKNDNDPVFKGDYTGFSVKENMEPSVHIGTIKATDRDSGNNGAIIYELDDEGRKHFSISPYGDIQALNTFDREKQESYEFIVIAKDKGKPTRSSSTNVRVRIHDMNDCKPKFVDNYVFELVESNGQMHIHKQLGQLKATDDDLGRSGEVTFRINSTQRASSRRNARKPQHRFQIDKNGRLSVYGIVDREVSTVLYVEIIAEDGGSPRLFATTLVTIQVLDLNDNAPQFRFPNNTRNKLNVSMEASIGTILGEIDAFDPDEGPNGTVTYKIVGGHSQSMFDLNTDGKLILAERIEARRLGRWSDRLNIEASDNGPVPKKGYMILEIQYTRDPTVGTKKTHQVDYDIAANNDSLTILYILAAVVFIVFIVVLSVLIYLYFRSRKLRARNKADVWHLKNRRISGPTVTQRPYNVDDCGNTDDLVQDAIHLKSAMDPQASSVCVFNDQDSSYTHLAMTAARAASYGYIPVMRGEGHYATYSPYTERRRRLASGNSLDGVLGGGTGTKDDNSYEHCQWNLVDDDGSQTGFKSSQKLPLNVARTATLGKVSLSAGRFATIGSSSDNLSGSRSAVGGEVYSTRDARGVNTYGTVLGDGFGVKKTGMEGMGSTKRLPDGNSYAFLQNYPEENRNNLGKNIDTTSGSKPSLDTAAFKSTLKTSPYVTSSFV